MCPPPRGAQGRAVAWKQTALAAHTQTFVTISRTFFFSLLLLPHWSQTLCAGEKLQPMPPAAPVTGDLGTHGPRRGRERRFWERGGEGRGALRGGPARLWKILLGHFSPWLYRALHHPGCPEGLSLVLSLSGNTGSICLEGGAQGSTQGQTSHS